MKTFINKNYITIFSCFALSLILFSSCKKNNEGIIVSGNAKVKVVNAAQGSNPQEFYQGDTKLSTTGVAYGETSTYLTAVAGNSSLSFKNLGSTTINATVNAGLNNDAFYTIFYYNSSSGNSQITGFQDDTAEPASGKAKVRFVNLGSAFNNNLNVVVTGGTTLVTGLAYGYSSNYSTIDANTSLSVSVINSGTISTIPGTTFQAGKIYTIWFDAVNSTTLNYHIIQQN